MVQWSACVVHMSLEVIHFVQKSMGRNTFWIPSIIVIPAMSYTSLHAAFATYSMWGGLVSGYRIGSMNMCPVLTKRNLQMLGNTLINIMGEDRSSLGVQVIDKIRPSNT